MQNNNQAASAVSMSHHQQIYWKIQQSISISTIFVKVHLSSFKNNKKFTRCATEFIRKY